MAQVKGNPEKSWVELTVKTPQGVVHTVCGWSNDWVIEVRHIAKTTLGLTPSPMSDEGQTADISMSLDRVNVVSAPVPTNTVHSWGAADGTS